jgi:hypothetical protein
MVAAARVTRLGEKNWAIVRHLSKLKVPKNINFLGHSFPKKPFSNKRDKVWIGQHFGRFFSQTHLVTLAAAEAEKWRNATNLLQRFSCHEQQTSTCLSAAVHNTIPVVSYVVEVAIGELVDVCCLCWYSHVEW